MPLVNDRNALEYSEVLQLPTEGEWVRLRTKLGKRAAVDIRKAGMRGATLRSADITAAAGGDLTAADVARAVDIDLDAVLEGSTFAFLEAAILGWCLNVDGELREDLPVTKENIEQLDEESFDAILSKLNELFPQRSEADRQDLSGAGAPTDEARPTPLPSSGG